jgi:alkylation response protein AidB-like acyl-CoA dehydrogenase
LVRAGRAFLTERLREAWATVTDGAALSWEQRGLLWLASTQAATNAIQAVELLFTAAGASAIYASTGLERCLRDVRTAAQHICVTPTNFEIAGQLALGLDVRQSVWSIDDRGFEL